METVLTGNEAVPPTSPHSVKSRQAAVLEQLRADVVGLDTPVTLYGGARRPYVFLDNAASTPTFRTVMKAIEEFMPWYSGVHRGTGVKSLVATDIYDRTHDIIGTFVGADLDANTVILVKNSTEAINKLANRLSLTKDDLVITTVMEHHSDDLPWRKHARVRHIGADTTGFLQLNDLQRTLQANKGKVKLVAVTGASNITGICPPIRLIAKWAHQAGAMIFVDAAQLAPHRPIDMLPNDHIEHIDFLAFSAHKLYAPFGTGVLIGPRHIFEQGEPDVVGGGVVTAVSLDEVYWNHPPHKDEAGSPNVIGAIALASAITRLGEIGMETVAEHEFQMLQHAYEKLRRIEGLELYGPTDEFSGKVGTIPFNITGMPNALVAAIFGTEFGIGLRNGCFCAQPYVKHLLGVSREEDERFTREIVAGNRSNMPGMLRASLGCYTSAGDIDLFIDALERIVRRDYRGHYTLDPVSGAYTEKEFSLDVDACFSFHRATAGHAGPRSASEAS